MGEEDGYAGPGAVDSIACLTLDCGVEVRRFTPYAPEALKGIELADYYLLQRVELGKLWNRRSPA